MKKLATLVVVAVIATASQIVHSKNPLPVTGSQIHFDNPLPISRVAGSKLDCPFAFRGTIGLDAGSGFDSGSQAHIEKGDPQIAAFVSLRYRNVIRRALELNSTAGTI